MYSNSASMTNSKLNEMNNKKVYIVNLVEFLYFQVHVTNNDNNDIYK